MKHQNLKCTTRNPYPKSKRPKLEKPKSHRQYFVRAGIQYDLVHAGIQYYLVHAGVQYHCVHAGIQYDLVLAGIPHGSFQEFQKEYCLSLCKFGDPLILQNRS